jgi:urease accessory protein
MAIVRLPGIVPATTPSGAPFGDHSFNGMRLPESLPRWHGGSFHPLPSMLQLIHAPINPSDLSLPGIELRVERLVLAKRIWRGTAADGVEFGFELERPLRHGDTFWQTATARYLIAQQPEAVVAISLDVAPSAAAGIGWAVGNLHLELQSEPTRLLAPDELAVRQLLERLKVPYQPTMAIFRPGRFARGNQSQHELGPSHQH